MPRPMACGIPETTLIVGSSNVYVAFLGLQGLQYPRSNLRYEAAQSFHKRFTKEYLESQVAQNNRPLYPKVAY